jgi:nondiscriminating aspartyl-tRNA synthetase
MVARITERGMDPEKFAFYLQAFKYGIPPHGGCSTGLERLTARMLNLANVKEASAFPRDMNRIDTLLSTDKGQE